MEGRNYVAELTRLFEEDPEMYVTAAWTLRIVMCRDEIGMVYLEEEGEAFVLADHKLGICMTKVPAIHGQSKHAFFEAAKAKDHDDTILATTRAMLLVCADFYTAWNARKSLITSGRLRAEDEIKFTSLVLTQHAKSIDTWAHRRWVVQRFLPQVDDRALPCPCTETHVCMFTGAAFLADELTLCAKLCEQYPRNYFAWSYRFFVGRLLAPPALAIELDANRAWCTQHVSDHSAWSYRLRLLPLSHVSLLHDELPFVARLLDLYPDREALWCHRRGVLQAIAADAPPPSSPFDGVDGPASPVSRIAERLSLDALVHHELHFAGAFDTHYALRYMVFCLELVLSPSVLELISA
ncbi:Aste57867_22446 [Aphanomyces stellatus]|uniref:Aste57867_22446 protein n=1 Tax=Aphanomyces stellatus TaxID=120398 RepID=A0A485LK99_9STRA|nr:hypothetical protein As57867_022376 [Aphanomyces stellatus]VFT99106.1 Aste57867_22446 [Aphanomyces stellatus]